MPFLPTMHEGPAGNSDTRTPLHLPSDAQRYAHSSSYQLYLSHSAKQLILSTIDYHSGKLHLSRQRLELMRTTILQPFSGIETEVLLTENQLPLPPAARLYKKTTYWDVHTLSGEAVFETNWYHAGVLYVSHEDLEELIIRC